MGVQRYVLRSGSVRYRARVKFHGREVATRVFERKADAIAWDQDQRRRLRLGEWKFDSSLSRVRRLTKPRELSQSAATSDSAIWPRRRSVGATTSGLVSANGRS